MFPHDQLWWDRISESRRCATTPTAPIRTSRASSRCPTARPSKPAFQLLQRARVASTRRNGPRSITGIPAATIRRLAHEMGVTARDQKIELPIAWTDCWGDEHETVTGNPVAFHAMRGLAAHSNGFQTIRALAILMSLLGTIDRPGGFRHKSPFPRAIPPTAKPPNSPRRCKPNTPLGGAAARLAGRARRLVRRRRGRSGAHRQGVLVGIPARGARHDAQRHHQRVARRSVSASTR